MLTNDDPVATPPGDVPVPDISGEDFSSMCGSEMPLLLAAELQDHLMTATNDLERLQRLLDHACEMLIS